MSLVSILLRVKKYSGEEALRVAGVSKYVRKYLAEMIENGICTVYGIVALNKVIGRIILYTELEDKDLADGENTCYFSDLWVHPKLRGYKLGSKLIKHVIKVAKKQGFKYLTLGVHLSNEKNVSMYKHLGFNEVIKSKTQDVVVKDREGNYITVKKYTIFMKEI